MKKFIKLFSIFLTIATIFVFALMTAPAFADIGPAPEYRTIGQNNLITLTGTYMHDPAGGMSGIFVENSIYNITGGIHPGSMSTLASATHAIGADAISRVYLIDNTFVQRTPAAFQFYDGPISYAAAYTGHLQVAETCADVATGIGANAINSLFV